MARMAHAAAVLALSTLLAACPESEHPLSDPAAAAPDPALYGTWRGSFEAGTTTWLHVGPGEDGMTRAVLVEHDARGVKHEQYLAFPTRLGRLQVLNVKPLDGNPHGYALVRYRVRGSALTLWLLSYMATRDDIQAGKLQGVVREGQYETRITAPSGELAAWLQGDPGRLFDKPLAFARAD